MESGESHQEVLASMDHTGPERLALACGVFRGLWFRGESGAVALVTGAVCALCGNPPPPTPQPTAVHSGMCSRTLGHAVAGSACGFSVGCCGVVVSWGMRRYALAIVLPVPLRSRCPLSLLAMCSVHSLPFVCVTYHCVPHSTSSLGATVLWQPKCGTQVGSMCATPECSLCALYSIGSLGAEFV